WIRANRGTPNSKASELPSIPSLVQSEGIQLVSQDWHAKLTELPQGHARQRFVDLLGRILREGLLKDKSMSYPGANGFSIRLSDLEDHQSVKRFLEDAVDYAALYDRIHTTRTNDRLPRR